MNSTVNSNRQLLQLTKDIRACRACPLHRKCKHPVPGVGIIGAKILICGQAPGWQEDKEGLPWIGQAGQFLSEILEFLGWSSKDIYFTNLAKCFPGRGKTGDYKPPPYAIEACSNWLAQEIDAVAPAVIIAVGAEAMKAFGIKGGINKNAGKVFESEYGVPVIPVLHPAGLMRRPTDTPNFVTSLRILRTFVNGFKEPPPWEETDAD